MISAILLAAGSSKRYGKKNKLLARYKKKYLLLHVLQKLVKSKADEIIVVTGQDRKKIERLVTINNKVKIVYNKNFKKGMSTSIKIGIKNLNKKSKGFLVCLGDMPKVSLDIYNKIIFDFKKNKKLPLAPYYKEKQGNPVCFPKSFTSKFKNLKGDIGAKKILTNVTLKKMKIHSKSILVDFDSKDDFIN